MSRKLLLLAGTAEARQLAGRLLDMPGIEVTASLAGVTRAPRSIAAPTRVGGFGGIEGLTTYLRRADIDVLIDATHSFSAQMPWHAAAAARKLGLPRLRLLRPPWPLGAAWHPVETLEAAAAALPKGARVFLATGRQHLEPFAARSDCWFLMRSIEPPKTLPTHFRHVAGPPGEDLAAEVGLIGSHRITHLISKNSGGRAHHKLDAADRLGVTVIIIARPEQPEGPVASTINEAVAWLEEMVGFNPPASKP